MENDAAYYALPDPKQAQLWSDRTPDGFTMDFKAFASITTHPTDAQRLPKDIRDSLPAAALEKRRLYPKDLPPEVRNEIHVRAGALLSKANGIVISDYEKGVVSEDVLKKVLPAAQAAGLPTAIDPKPPNFPFYKPASVVTPNIHEAREIVGSRGRDEKEIQEMGQILLERLGCDAVLLTRGEEGMTLFEASREPFRIPATAREVFDVTGAGDTVVAVLALCLVAQATMPEAAFLANLAAGLVVGKLGTAIVTQDELISALPGGG